MEKQEDIFFYKCFEKLTYFGFREKVICYKQKEGKAEIKTFIDEDFIPLPRIYLAPFEDKFETRIHYLNFNNYYNNLDIKDNFIIKEEKLLKKVFNVKELEILYE